MFQLTTHQELWTYIVTNLASVYIREGNRHQEVSKKKNNGHIFKSQQNEALLKVVFTSLIHPTSYHGCIGFGVCVWASE